MKKRPIFSAATLLALIFLSYGILVGGANPGKKESASAAAWTPQIPRSWVDDEMKSLEIPLVSREETPRHVSADFYYRMLELPIYKSCPIYRPDKEPPGYFEGLKQKEPELAFDPSKLKTREDWIRAGEIVFKAPIFYNGLNTVADVRNMAWYESRKMPVTKDGIMPYNVYTIRKKGEIDVGEFSCATCHTRVMPDGTVASGAQGNYPLGRLDELNIRKHVNRPDAAIFKKVARGAFVLGYYVPWLKPDELEEFDKMSLDEVANYSAALVPGVQERPGVSMMYPVQVPDLIGVKDRKYLDHTGLQLHRSIVDMMRYASLNQGANFLDSYGSFIPRGQLTDPRKIRPRYSDAELYALALYIYSLQPPSNPNHFDSLAARGKDIFEKQGCPFCHTPPLYTNNKLTPVEGFEVPPEDKEKFDILPVVVQTDPGLALRSRRSTGYYKVPSLKGVWYRGPFEHSGSVATLEDWFDPRRLRDDYVATGFRGVHVTHGAVTGHPFGLTLSEDDRRALIAFLKTL